MRYSVILVLALLLAGNAFAQENISNEEELTYSVIEAEDRAEPTDRDMGNIRGNLLELTYKTTNLLTGPLFVPFFMAMFIRKAKPVATFIGTLLSGVTAVLVGFSYELLSIEISFLWIIPLSFSVGLVVSMVLSYLPFEKNKSQPSQFISLNPCPL